MSVPVRPEAIQAAISAAEIPAGRETAARQLERGIQAFLAAEEIEEHTEYKSPPFSAPHPAKPIPVRSRLRGPWRRVDGDA